jgi:hypothetical protein
MMISMAAMLTSCTPMIKLVYGIKSPAPVTHAEVIQFRNKALSDTIQTVFLRPQASLDITEWSVPEAFLFDSNGRPIDFRNPEKPHCNGSLSGFLENLRPGQQHPPAMLEHMRLLMHDFSSMPCRNESVKLPSADYHLMITFATWAGKHIFRQTVQPWIHSAQANKHVKIHVILLNVEECCCDNGYNIIQ